MCSKMINGGGWAQQLGWHACPRHTAHLCRRFPHRLRRLGAASCRSRWNLCVPPTMMLVGEDWRAGEGINSYGSGPVQGEGLVCMARRAEAVRSRTIHSARPAGVSRVILKQCGSTADSTVAIIETAFHYVNCHPRGDPVSSLSNDILTQFNRSSLRSRQSFEPDTLRTGSMCSKMMNGGG